MSNGSFDKGLGEGLKAVGRIAVSTAAGAAGVGLAKNVAQIGSLAGRLALNTAGSGAIGAGASVANQTINAGGDITAVDGGRVLDDAVTGAAFGAAGSALGEGVEAIGRASAAATYNSLPTSTKVFNSHVANATPGQVVNTGQSAGSTAVGVANVVSNTVSNSAGPLGDAVRNGVGETVSGCMVGGECP